MSNGKVKIYKNHARNQAEQVQAYVPQHKILGVEPREYKSAVVPGAQLAAPQEPIQRVRQTTIRQPYAEPVPSPIGKGPLPNVGNNVEHTWSSGVDGEIIDDLDQPLDLAHPMIDNNDYVSNSALGIPQEELPTLNEVQNPPRKRFTQEEVGQAFSHGFNKTQASAEEDLFPVVRDLEEGAFLLIVNGVPICSGPKEEIEDQTRALVFGEHEMCDGNPIPDDDIVIIKRVPIKIGLFLE
jgi:hypothetical protein